MNNTRNKKGQKPAFDELHVPAAPDDVVQPNLVLPLQLQAPGKGREDVPQAKKYQASTSLGPDNHLDRNKICSI